MRVAVVSGPRAAEPMGLELAELRLLAALREQAGDIDLDVRVVGAGRARRHARRLGARWIPARRDTLPRISSSGADLIHLVGLDLPPPRGKPFVAMVHDLSPLYYDDEGVLPPWVDEIAHRASLLLTPSRFTATELSRHLSVPPERIRVIGGAPALEARDAEPLSSEELHRLGIEPPFVLRYGGYTKRKNVPLLLEAWADVPSGSLVLTGPPQAARARILEQAPALDRVVVLDYVPKDLLARLLRSAAVLASTSSYEGFGLPPLEAMAAGTPVVAASATFVDEVCGDAALIVEAQPGALADALRRAMSDATVAERLRVAGLARAEGFAWKNAASAVLGAYGSLASRI